MLKQENEKYWNESENRKLASARVIAFFETHPEAKEYLKEIAKEQWNNEDLKKWRSNKTKEQWTKEFREKRKESYDKTYYSKTISFMKRILEKEGNLDNFDII